jgi:cytoskeletal protein CcmA (bactofilin family)
MWNRRKQDDEIQTKPVAAPPTSSELAKEGIPMSTLPGRSHESDLSRGSATIGKSVVIKGQILSREDLIVDGEVEGTVELQENRLTIGPNGKLTASVKAREIIVLGTVHGNVEASEKIDIRKDAKLVGDIRTMRIVIEDGAYFKGSIDIIKPEVAKPAPAVKPPAPPAQQTMAASAGEIKK